MKPVRPPDFRYDLVVREEIVAGRTWRLEQLRDFERTVDQLGRRLDSAATRAWLDDYCPMFGAIWPATRALSALVATENLAGQRVIELGCGLALPSLVAHAAGADVLATDLHPDAPDFLVNNVARNELPPLRFAALDWRHPDDAGLRAASFDRVIGSDILYERGLCPLVATVAAWLLAPGGHLTIADPGRPHLDGFLRALADVGLPPTLEVAPARAADGSAVEVFLVHATARATG